MSIVIRDVREHELDSVLALNNNAGLAILPLDAAKIRRFYETAEYFRVAERDGNRLYYRANAAHPLFPTLRQLVRQTTASTDTRQPSAAPAPTAPPATAHGQPATANRPRSTAHRPPSTVLPTLTLNEFD